MEALYRKMFSSLAHLLGVCLKRNKRSKKPGLPVGGGELIASALS